MLLRPVDIREQVKKIVASYLKDEVVHDVLVELMVSATSHNILSITVVLKPRPNIKLRGEDATSIALDTRNYLLEQGDDRFPHFRFVTTKELQALRESDD